MVKFYFFMIALFFLALSSLDYRKERLSIVTKKILESKEISSDLPPEIFPFLIDAVSTVLFKDGKNLTQINNISDAIIHCRGGSGKDIPAGPGLLKEMTYFDSYKEAFDPEKGTLAQKISEQLIASAAKADEGNLTGSGSYVLICLTLGHYVPQYKYSIPYKCTSADGVRTCKAEGDVTFTGRDVWDFEPLSTYTWWQNLIFEIIPEFLVLLRGPSVPYGIPYQNTIHYSFTKQV